MPRLGPSLAFASLVVGLTMLAAAGGGRLAFAEERTVIVRPGETLSGIAQRNRTTVAALVEANRIRDPSRVPAGSRLRIPDEAGTARPSVARTSTAAPEAPTRPPARPADGGEKRFVWRTSGEITPEGVMHVVQPGQTLNDIARAYDVTVAALRNANHLGIQSTLLIGARVLVPRATAIRPVRSVAPGEARLLKKGRRGPIEFLRASNDESARIALYRPNGRVSPEGRRRLEHLLRALPYNIEHPIHPRIAELLQRVADRWPSQRMIVVSGYRPQTRSQYTLHSRHNLGMAVDFRVEGVPNTIVRDFCRTFLRAGVGYYPNSSFVHLDVRREAGYWVDYSRPGDPPVYRSEEPEEPMVVERSAIYAATAASVAPAAAANPAAAAGEEHEAEEAPQLQPGGDAASAGSSPAAPPTAARPGPASGG